MNRRLLLKKTLCVAGLTSWQSLLANGVLANTALANSALTNTALANTVKATDLEQSPETKQISLYASAFTTAAGVHTLALFDQQAIRWTVVLPERAHAPIFHPNQALIGIVARRPGNYLNLYDIANGTLLNQITPTKDHHFYGHGLFTHNGQQLFTTENHYPTGSGKIFLRDWQNNRIIQEFPSYGVGPHELHLLDNETLVVANGGLQTHPQTGREILNLDSMASNLTFIDIKTGALLKTLALPANWQHLSIRHIDVNSFGEVVMGFQYQGAPFDDVPLIGKASLQHNEIEILPMPAQIKQRFQQYCGSVTLDQSGQLLAASSPRGGIVAYWDLKTGNFFQHHNYRDVCGIAPTEQPHHFLLTTGRGKRIIVNPITGTKVKLPTHAHYRWDNHIHQLSL